MHGCGISYWASLLPRGENDKNSDGAGPLVSDSLNAKGYGVLRGVGSEQIGRLVAIVSARQTRGVGYSTPAGENFGAHRGDAQEARSRRARA